MCRNVQDAEDVLQDTLINVAQHLGDFEGRSSLTSWVFALTRSACARKRRGLKNQPHVSDERLVESADLAPSPETRLANQELASALSVALDRLSDEHREAILLRDVEGLSAPEAASSIGISVDALKSRLHRAREALREAFLPLLEPRREQARTGCPDVVELWSKKLEGDLSAARGPGEGQGRRSGLGGAKWIPNLARTQWPLRRVYLVRHEDVCHWRSQACCFVSYSTRILRPTPTC